MIFLGGREYIQRERWLINNIEGTGRRRQQIARPLKRSNERQQNLERV
jgi:hypothetical protein